MKPSSVVVGGMAFRGMSTTVVAPPEAAAFVPVLGHPPSVRPGSLARVDMAIDEPREEDPRAVRIPVYVTEGRGRRTEAGAWGLWTRSCPWRERWR